MSSAVKRKWNKTHWLFRRSLILSIELKRICETQKVVRLLHHSYSISVFIHILMMNAARSGRILHMDGSNLYSTFALCAFRYRYTANTYLPTTNALAKSARLTARNLWLRITYGLNSVAQANDPSRADGSSYYYPFIFSLVQ